MGELVADARRVLFHLTYGAFQWEAPDEPEMNGETRLYVTGLPREYNKSVGRVYGPSVPFPPGTVPQGGDPTVGYFEVAGCRSSAVAPQEFIPRWHWECGDGLFGRNDSEAGTKRDCENRIVAEVLK